MNKSLKRSHYHARDLEELKAICKSSSNEWAHRETKLSLKMFHLVRDDIIKGELLRTFIRLSELIQRRNVYLTNINQLEDDIGAKGKKFNREVLKLEKAGLIKMFKPLGQKNPLRVVAFNPFLVWRGCYIVKKALQVKISGSDQAWYDVSL